MNFAQYLRGRSHHPIRPNVAKDMAKIRDINTSIRERRHNGSWQGSMTRHLFDYLVINARI
jgi:hypothetical protein